MDEIKAHGPNIFDPFGLMMFVEGEMWRKKMLASWWPIVLSSCFQFSNLFPTIESIR